MAKLKSTVIAGEFANSEIIKTSFLGNHLTIMLKESFLQSQAIDLTQRTVSMYEILDEEMLQASLSKILEEKEELCEKIKPFVFSAPERNAYVVAIKYKNDHISVLELDEKKLFCLVETFKKPDILNYM